MKNNVVLSRKVLVCLIVIMVLNLAIWCTVGISKLIPEKKGEYDVPELYTACCEGYDIVSNTSKFYIFQTGEYVDIYGYYPTGEVLMDTSYSVIWYPYGDIAKSAKG